MEKSVSIKFAASLTNRYALSTTQKRVQNEVRNPIVSPFLDDGIKIPSFYPQNTLKLKEKVNSSKEGNRSE
jgi:hypothetical protein